MKPEEMLYCISLRDESETEGAGVEVLSALYENLSTWRDEESKVIHHTLYFQTQSESQQAFTFLEQEISQWEQYGIKISELKSFSLKKEDWAESWKIHFKPIVISERLAIKPSWEKLSPLPGQVVLTLDPGMSFGTGQHATTKFCLAAIDKFTEKKMSLNQAEKLSFLDAGTGSGILAVAAVKLGCAPVAAFDIDPDTIPVAKENAEINGLSAQDIVFDVASLDDYKCERRYDIVAANILSSALIAGKRKLLSMVKPGGYLILAGILDTEYAHVREEFEAIGCKQLFSEVEKEWRGGAFSVN